MEDGRAGERGALQCRIEREVRGDDAWLRGATDFLLRGLQDLRDEFPGALTVTVDVTEE